MGLGVAGHIGDDDGEVGKEIAVAAESMARSSTATCRGSTFYIASAFRRLVSRISLVHVTFGRCAPFPFIVPHDMDPNLRLIWIGPEEITLTKLTQNGEK